MYSLRRRLSEISQGQWKFSCDNLNSLASLGVALNHSCWAENYSFGLLVCFWHRISCNLGWLQTSVTPAFTSRVQGLQVCTSTPCLCGLVDGTPGLYELPNEPRLQLRLKWSCWLTAWPSHPPTLQSAKNCMPWGGFFLKQGRCLLPQHRCLVAKVFPLLSANSNAQEGRGFRRSASLEGEARQLWTEAREGSL